MRPLAAAGPYTRATLKKPARELRQGGSDYRCCIPALAGFVSPQSIAPDGEQTFSQESQRATRNHAAIGSVHRAAMSGRRSAPSLSFSRMGDSPLYVLRRWYAQALPCPDD